MEIIKILSTFPFPPTFSAGQPWLSECVAGQESWSERLGCAALRGILLGRVSPTRGTTTLKH